MGLSNLWAGVTQELREIVISPELPPKQPLLYSVRESVKLKKFFIGAWNSYSSSTTLKSGMDENEQWVVAWV